MVSASSRRVSYMIPPPAEPVPHLLLPSLDTPRNGRSAPLIVPATPASWSPSPLAGLAPAQQHPRHRLAVASLALDASTQLLGRPSPEGILYTGGRDGLIISWELGMRMRRRIAGPDDGYGPGKPKRWEAITGWDDEFDEEDEESPVLAGDVLGDVSKRKRSNTLSDSEVLAWEDQWEVYEHGPVDAPAAFRQSVQAHTDWVNDLLLFNFNQTVISASSDGTIKAWNPNSSTSQDLAIIGQHADYVKCLAHSRTQPWIASGSFDRTIKLWDVSRATSAPSPSVADPISTLTTPETAGDLKASVYALATDSFGQLIASGSPERIVRLWDARSGKSTSKLVGHTDNIRALIVSADGRWLLSGSADASIKLWSLASPQRCLHTFSHHISSVWSMASLHPQLSTFYSGDRDGLLCRVDVGACDDVSEGECVVLAKEEGGVCAIAPLRSGSDETPESNGGRVYVSSGTSSANCWRDVRSRRARFDAAVLRGEVVGSPTSEEAVTPPTQPQGMSSGYIFPRSRHGVTFNNAPGLDRHGSSGSTQHAHPTSHGFSISSLADLESPGRTPPGRQFTGYAHRAPSPAVSNSHSTTEHTDGPPELYGVTVDSLVRLGPPADAYGGYPGMYSGTMYHTAQSAGRKDADAATLYSVASIRSGVGVGMQPHRTQTQMSPHSHSFSLSIPPLHAMSADGHGAIDDKSPLVTYLAREIAAEARPLRSQPLDIISGSSARGIVRSVLLNDRIHALTVDTAGEVRIWDVVRCICKGVFVGEQRSISSPVEINLRSADDSSSHKKPLSLSIASKSPREALEDVRERIEGEVVSNAWATVDTRIGELTVHMAEGRCFEAEVYADEAGYGSERAFEDDLRLNVGKWVLSNLFNAFVKEQVRRLTATSPPASSRSLPDIPSAAQPPPPHATGGAGSLARDFSQTLTLTFDNHRARTMTDMAASGRIAAGTLPTPGFGITSVTSPAMTPVVVPEGATTPVPVPPSASKEQKLLPTIQLSAVPEGSPALSSSTATPAATMTPAPSRKTESPGDYFTSAKAKRPGTSGSEGDDFSGWTGPGKGGPVAGGKDKDEPLIPQTPTGASGGIMSRWKLFTRQNSKRPLSGEGQDAAGSKESAADAAAKETAAQFEVEAPFNFASTLPSPLTLPTANDAPPLYLPPHVGLMISEATPATASGWVVLYRGSVGNTGDAEDILSLERAMPPWLVDYLFAGRIPPEAHKAASGVKLSFVLLPWQDPGYGEVLPRVMDPNTRLTASRFLRARKVANYVADTLKSQGALSRTSTRTSTDDAAAVRSVRSTNSPRPTTSGSATPAQQHLNVQPPGTPRSRAASLDESAVPAPDARDQTVLGLSGASYELLTNDVVLPGEMTLAAVRQFVWKQANDLVLYYRRKSPVDTEALSLSRASSRTTLEPRAE
ncbi:WD40 repeat-like protein [Exidia glandulosa HHB12029]|uniref:WD40 repeat-like protein n=1 Tax=Exidia glandulosa HHB12029 TaxID=1314781 RepID=A0A165Q6Y2_EXIGL|nr:WD40 repeat-like protein [Exidia glandulosa HHB12029]